MNFRILGRSSLVCALAFAALGAGCSSEPSTTAESTNASGTLSLPLVTSTNGHTYRLSGTLYVSGPAFQVFYFGYETELKASLPTGGYSSYLFDYSLSRLDDDGVYQPVQATLLSSYYQPFSIYNGATTTVTYEFETDGFTVSVGAGNLAVDVNVTETPPVCSPLGSDCPEGTWCAPPELTSQPIACIAAGSSELGAPCSGPASCVANSSCYDFGTGPRCVALCAAEAFGQACPEGGTCTAQGKSYGVCAPDTGAGGEGGAGGTGADGG